MRSKTQTRRGNLGVVHVAAARPISRTVGLNFERFSGRLTFEKWDVTVIGADCQPQ